MEQKPIHRAVDIAKGQTALAALIGCSQSTVWDWLNGKSRVSPDACIPIEEATAGKVTRYDLRPDVFGEAPKRARRAA